MPALLGLLLICSPGCHRNNDGPVLKGKLVLAAGCGNWVVQLLEGNIPPGQIAASWKDSVTNIVYTNVFAISNTCAFDAYHLNKGDVFRFQLASEVKDQTCFYCLLYYPTPPAMNAVKNVQKLN